MLRRYRNPGDHAVAGATRLRHALVVGLLALTACRDNPPTTTPVEPPPAPVERPRETPDGDARTPSEPVTQRAFVPAERPDAPEVQAPRVANENVAPAVYANNAVDLSPRFRIGDTQRRTITWTKHSAVSVDAGGERVSSQLQSRVEAVVSLRVAAAASGTPTRIDVTFEAFAREANGVAAPQRDDPAVGERWRCETHRASPLCEFDGRAFPLPSWLPVSSVPLLPSRPVAPGETWSRRVGVAPSVGLGDSAVARATLQAEPRYETATGTYSTVSLTFEGEEPIDAFGRATRMTTTGEGALEFDLRNGRVVALDIRWEGSAAGHRRGRHGVTSFHRETSVVLRATDL